MLTACGGDDSSADSHRDSGAGSLGSDAGSATSSGASTGPVAVETDFAVASKLAGTYVGKLTMRKVESVGPLGSMDALVTMYGLFEVVVDAKAQATQLAVSYCRAELTGTGTGLLTSAGVDTPDVVMTSTKVDPVPFSAMRNKSGATVWSVPDVVAPVGWMWTSSTDALPTSAGDDRVWDQDNDGHPGVTTAVTLSGNPTPVYVVQLLSDRYAGSVDDDGNLSGTVRDATKQVVLGSPNPLLAVAALTDVPAEDTSDNVIRLRKVDAAPSCAELVAATDTYFPAK